MSHSHIPHENRRFCWKIYFLRCWLGSPFRLSGNAALLHLAKYPRLTFKAARQAFHLFKFSLGGRLRWYLEWWGLLPESRRRALLIGIGHDEDDGRVTLAGPRRDARALKQLLMDVYGYQEENIVMMLDGPDETNHLLRPTRENMLREIGNLTKGAKAGDRFFFHFTGHSIQVPNHTGTEDDGMDEAIMSIDNNFLIDNTLKERLVDPLPVGCKLVAIFDTCHSASLLDLKHHRCNRVTMPWVPIKLHSSYQPLLSGTVTSKSSFRLYETRRTPLKLKLRKSTLDIHAPTTQKPTKILRVDTQSTILTHHTTLKVGSSGTGSELEFSNKNTSTESSSVRFADILGSPVEFCASPTSLLHCDGAAQCDVDSEEIGDHADVLAIGACKDEQTAWETNGQSMTSMLIDILRENPHPSLKKLMYDISYNTHAMILQMQDKWRSLPEEEKKTYTKQGQLDIDPARSFQHPQLASHSKLDMDLPFAL